ncbi:MAG: hypothetical protein WCG06_05605, partial [Candidatus Omnitrophota bacterium]
MLINIQDAHSKLGAQESITRIIDNLVGNFNLRQVYIEGSAGTIDTSLVSTFPIQEVRQKTAAHLMGEGKISAAEFCSMISDKKDLKIYGVEDPELYREDLQAFKQLAERKQVIRVQLKGLKRLIGELEEKVYSDKLKEFSSRKLLKQNGQVHFTEYWDFYRRLAAEKAVDLKPYPNLMKLSETVDLESEIDFKKANVERDQLVAELYKRLPKFELEGFVLKMLQYKQNKISPAAFHYVLSKSAMNVQIDPVRYRNIILYSEYVVRFEEINLVGIFEEVEAFEDVVREKLFANDRERQLASMARSIRILAQLLDSALNSKDYAAFVAHPDQFRIASILAALGGLCAEYGLGMPSSYCDFTALEEAMPSATKFYELAERRNKALLDNTLRRMKEQGVHLAALVSGGFHTDGIAQLLNQNKLSYLVVMPKFDDKSPDRPYVTILTQKPKEYEELFKDSDEFYIACSSFWAAQKSLWADENVLDERRAAYAAMLFYLQRLTGSITAEINQLHLVEFEKVQNQMVADGILSAGEASANVAMLSG